MATAGDVVRDALKHLKVLAAGETPCGEDMTEGLRALNLMVRRWEASGLSLGWTDVSNPANVLTSPAELEEMLGYHLAIRLRARFGASLDPDIIGLAEQGMADLRADVLGSQHVRLSYPDLPGTGCGGDFLDG